MWIASKYGFYSIAAAYADDGSPDPTTFLIRARAKEHLVALRKRFGTLKGITIQTNTGTDYPYRMAVGSGEARFVVAALVADIDYTNFKNAAEAQAKGDRAYVDFLHRIWHLGLSLTRPDAKLRGAEGVYGRRG